MFFSVIATSWRICLFRAGPQDYPASNQAVAHAVMLALAVHVVQFQLSLPVFAAIVQAIVAVLVMWSFTTAVLTMRKKPERVPQTVSALLVTNAIFSLLLVPFLIPMLPAMEQATQNPDAQIDVPAISLIGTLGLSLWSLAVSIWIYRNALESRSGLAILAAVGMAAVVYIIAGGVGTMLVPQGS